jgi:hypothetical protein
MLKRMKVVKIVVECEVEGRKGREVVVFENDGESVEGNLSYEGVDVVLEVLVKREERRRGEL